MEINKTTSYPTRFATQCMQPLSYCNADVFSFSPQFSFSAIRCMGAEQMEHVEKNVEKRTGNQCEQPTRNHGDMMFIQFRVTPNGNPRLEQKDIAMRIACTLGVKCVYRKPKASDDNHPAIFDHGSYTAAGWHIADYTITSNWFSLDDLQEVLEVMGTLSSYHYDGEIRINYRPERYDLTMLMNVSTIMEARRPLIEEVLGLTDELKIVITQYLTFSFALDVFNLPAIEACVCLLHQAARMGIATKKARMKPYDQTDMSNPKFQMRSWLLRLGFIGEKFERPRRTLLEGLEGNGAFFGEESRQKAVDMRRRKKALALVAKARIQKVSVVNNDENTPVASAPVSTMLSETGAPTVEIQSVHRVHRIRRK